jgi:L-Lysine epsilon oxidase N-terminal/L-lysine epsilon oxidase C-terminal domain
MAEYKVFPAIGVARVGNAPEKFYVGPETYRGLPINPDGRPFTEADFRDGSGRLCRQAARFRVYRIENSGAEEVTLHSPGIRSITWTAHLANKKPSWYSFETSLGEDGYAPNHPLRNADMSDRHKLIIDAGPRSIAGPSVMGASFDRFSVPAGYRGAHFPEATLNPVGLAIDSLGELATDAEGHLLVLGGLGISGSTDKNPVISHYANNDNWWDDTADGPVGARVEFADGTAIDAAPAWVVVAPPSYVPQIPNLVSLYDTIFDAAVRAGHFPAIFENGLWKAGTDGYRPNFSTDIRPMLERASLYPWVAAIPPKPHDFPFEKLGMLGPDGLGRTDFTGLRRYLLDFVRPPDGENVIVGANGATMMPYLAGDNCLIPGHAPNRYLRLTDTQYFFLQQWADGWFGDMASAANSADALTRAVLENCVGGAFSPGIEMTWIARNQSIYAEPFRIRAQFVPNGPLSLGFDPARGMQPGDITRYMAVPWQADFNECSSQPIDGRTLWWWPAQRPEFVYLEPERRALTAALPPPPDESTGRQVAWIGTDFDQMGADFIAFADDVDMVKYWQELGFVFEKEIDGKLRFVEVQRTLPRPFIPDGEG